MLFIFGVVLFNIFYPSDKKNADKFLGSFDGKLETLSVGDEETFLFQTTKNIADWDVFAWGRNEADKPDKCALDACVCLCPPSTSILPSDSERCQQNGMCKRYNVASARVDFVENLLDDDGSIFKICRNQNMVGLTKLQSNALPLTVRKEVSSIIISNVRNIPREQWKPYEESEALRLKCESPSE
jgi:hypothetical protein